VSVEIFPFTMQDYPEVIALWQTTEGMGLSSADSAERIAAYLQHNPGMSFVARLNGELVGAVLSGHDGRRGYLHHLAVRADRRGQGTGSLLVERCLAALKLAGIEKCHLFVYKDNSSGQEFWRKVGWVERVELVVMSKDI
jgi:ribosomal protein S18 acetylase RimI-like enzyme